MVVSYAQNGEDVILWRVLGARKKGFYIDVGACWPDDGSVTKLFYDAGWSGINIEPHPETFKALCNARPRDVNLQVGISSNVGKGVLVEGPSAGEASIVGGTGGKRFDIDVWTLRKVCDRFVTTPIDFLKIDVEGNELEVLRGSDLVSYRPKVIVCEITKPWSNVKSVDAREIDAFLAENDYVHVYFDGLNSFYVSREETEILSCAWIQPNPIDRYITSREADLVARIEAAMAEKQRANAELEHLATEHAARESDLRAKLDAVTIERQLADSELGRLTAEHVARDSDLRAKLEAVTTEKQHAESELGRLTAEHAAREVELRARVEAGAKEVSRLHDVIREQSTWGEASVRHVNQLAAEIESLRNSTSWQITAPIRRVGVVVKSGSSLIRPAPRGIVRRVALFVHRRAPRFYSRLAAARWLRSIYKQITKSPLSPPARPKGMEQHPAQEPLTPADRDGSMLNESIPKQAEPKLLSAISKWRLGKRIHA
ncbi:MULTISPECIES: FkbM family methyltransferase [unclassified Bradyrhizobium]|uniref:FkbM family methyltransferase n=1 Tax=unclassified Bradyrhizobium TaxID=2631580 RepID=UPI0028F14304|nr:MULTISPECIES: FkbM family methyltransferase [unclassified Bradyrhizobium]